MAARSSWKGYLRLSLVSIPVKAYTATSSGGDIALHQLHRGCHHRVRYQRVCPVHGEIAQEEIVSGYESAPGQYVIIDPDELDALRTTSDKSIRVEGFIRCDALDAAYHSGRTYYLVPDGPVGQRAYLLLRACLSERRMQGVAQIVLSGKEHLVLLRPAGRLLALTVLSYDSEVKRAAAFEDEIPDLPPTGEELELGLTLVASLTRDDFEIADYTDGYRTRLSRLIEAKVQGQPLVIPARDGDGETAAVDLLAALQASLEAARALPAADGPPPRMAPSARELPTAAALQRQSG